MEGLSTIAQVELQVVGDYMRLINNLTDNVSQTSRIILEDGSELNLTLVYMENQQGWFFSLVWGSFIINNKRLVVGLNLLRQFRDLIPFGLACDSMDGYEPVYVDDFSSGRIKVYTLNAVDVLTIENNLYKYA